MKKQRPVLTISLLISNRPDTIRRCLDSLRPLMEAVPSELILTDTSQKTDINAICCEYTDKVFEFEWCHDFAKARNFGLEKAEGEWFLFLDDDEWFVDVEELVAFFQSGEYKDYGRATYLVRNFYDPSYVQYADCWVSRMNQINADSHFVGKVHEYMEPCIGAEKHISSLAYHSGYVFLTEEERSRHAERNIVLLLEALKEEPYNIRWQTQLAQEYRSAMDWARLVTYCKERINSSEKDEMDDVTRLQFGTFYAGLVEGLVHEKDYQECIIRCEEIIKDAQANPLLKAHAYICQSEAYFVLGDWDSASVCSNNYLKEEQRLNGTDVLSYEQKLVSIVQHAFDPSNKKKAYSILICQNLKQGSTECLHKYYEELEWNEIENYVFEALPSYLIEMMPKLEYEPIFSRVIEDAFKREDFKIFMCREALKWEEKDPEKFAKLAYIFAKLEDTFWFIWYMKVVDAAYRGDVSGLQVLTRSVWEEQIRGFVKDANIGQVTKVGTYLSEMLSEEDWKKIYFENIVIERMVMDGPVDLGNLEDYYLVLQNYAKMGCILESTAQAVGKIAAYIELKSQDRLEALKQLKAAVDICPDFAEGIGRFLACYSDLENQRVYKQHMEMQNLRQQVLGQVYALVANGNQKEALTIVQQLKQMFPDDLEIATLGLEIRLK